jgi:hypothetical protein
MNTLLKFIDTGSRFLQSTRDLHNASSRQTNIMKKVVNLFLFLSAFTLISGCATILCGTNWPLTVRTSPDGANVQVKNKEGVVVYSGTSPATLKLRSGAGYFAKESYTVSLNLPGYEPKTVNVECRINGWYFGNIFLGGLLGMLIVDPATGAMYKLDTKDIKENLISIPNPTNGAAHSLIILEKDQLSSSMQNAMVLLK